MRRVKHDGDESSTDLDDSSLESGKDLGAIALIGRRSVSNQGWLYGLACYFSGAHHYP